MRQPLLHAVSLAGALAAGACAPEYTYVPEANATARVNGRPASDYGVPPEAPTGDLRIASFGFADLSAGPPGAPAEEQNATSKKDATGGTLCSAHLRLVIANESDREWSLDTRQQRLERAGKDQSAPAFASADAGSSPPVVAVPPHGKRTVDLFFPLGPGASQADELPSFDVVWTLQTGGRAVSQRTPFTRVAVEPPPSAYEAAGVVGPYGPYWYDPAYVGFYGPVGLPPAYLRGPVYAHRFHGGHEGGRP